MPPFPPQGAISLTFLSRHSLGNGTMVMLVLLSLRCGMNTLLAGCPDGAHTFATMESIIQTANLWNPDVYGYVTFLLKEMVRLRSLKANSVDYSQFLPWNLTPKLRKEMDVHSISIKKRKSV
ncbi:MAG: hypothetical protein WBI82_05875 [Sphaerochaeta sp.]